MNKFGLNVCGRIKGHILWVLVVFLPIDLYANPRCSNFNVEFDIEPKEINVTGKNIGDVIANIVVTSVSGTCDFTNASGTADQAYLTYVKSANNLINNRPHDMSGTVALRPNAGTAGDRNSFLVRNGARAEGVTNLSTWLKLGKDNHNSSIYLMKKTPGVINVNINELTNGFNSIYSSLGTFFNSALAEYPVVINKIQPISITYIPTCSASVNDVTFPPTRSSEIQSGIAKEQIALVSVSCDDILPKYSIEVSSPKGMESASNGIIKSENASVGYKLSWKNSGSPVQLGVASTPYTPTTNSFEIPISVKPVKLGSHTGNIILGSANSSIKVDLKFN